jgi:hypothetical protein
MNNIVDAIYYGCIEEIGASNEHGSDVRKAEDHEKPEFYGVYLRRKDGEVLLNDWIYDFMSADKAEALTDRINNVIQRASLTDGIDLVLRTENLMHALQTLDNAAMKLADEIDRGTFQRATNLMNLHNAHMQVKELMESIKEDNLTT